MPAKELNQTALSNLEELKTVLYDLEIPHSDREFLGSLPPRKLLAIAELAEVVVYGCQPDHRLQIKIGKEAIRGYITDNSTDEIHTEHGKKLTPGTELVVDRFVRRYDTEAHNLNSYFSDGITLLSLGSTALNLQQGGEVSLIRSNVAE